MWVAETQTLGPSVAIPVLRELGWKWTGRDVQHEILNIKDLVLWKYFSPFSDETTAVHSLAKYAEPSCFFRNVKPYILATVICKGTLVSSWCIVTLICESYSLTYYARQAKYSQKLTLSF